MPNERGLTGAHSRERQKVILWGAAIIPLFALADTVALGRFSLRAFSVRILWAALTAWLGWAWPRASPAGQRGLAVALGVSTSFFFAVMVELTGGSHSPLFHWILAMPLVVAVVLQEHPQATLAAAITTLISGVTILAWEGQGATLAAPWAVQAAGMSGLAYYAASSYARLRRNEATANRLRMEALERAALYEDEVQARARAEGAVRARDEFLSVASHELKTPLTSLALHVQSLELALGRSGGAQATGEFARKTHAIDRQTRRLNSLVDALLDVSRLSIGHLELQLEPVNLKEVAQEVVARLQQDARHAESALTLHAEGEWIGRWDGLRIEQVLTNLISNALKYGRGHPVEVTLSGEGESALLTVRDHGIGISAEDQERIFDRFARAVSSRHYGGLGLGLWIVHQVVSAMGGEIRVESEPGRGAAFSVRLPLAGPTSISNGAPREAH